MYPQSMFRAKLKKGNHICFAFEIVIITTIKFAACLRNAFHDCHFPLAAESYCKWCSIIIIRN